MKRSFESNGKTLNVYLRTMDPTLLWRSTIVRNVIHIFSIATNDTACVKHKIPQIYVYSILITVTELMDLFRGIQRIGEISDRVLELTTELLSINPVIQSCINLINPYQCVNRFRCTPAKANYTVWKYRRDCLKYLHVC